MGRKPKAELEPVFDEEVLESLNLDEDFVKLEDEDKQCDSYTPEDTTDDRPKMSSLEWSDWVMSQLDKSELYEGNPTCDGLRRVSIKLFGHLTTHPPQVHNCNEGYAAVTCTLSWSGPYGNKQASGSADAHMGNTELPYSNHPLAMAETRAMSRALRFALDLRKVVTAEEMSKKSYTSIAISDEDKVEGNINDTQINFIKLLCKKHDISVEFVTKTWLNANNKEGEKEFLSELKYVEAQGVQDLLNQWIGKRPEVIEKYNPQWEDTFLAKKETK